MLNAYLAHLVRSRANKGKEVVAMEKIQIIEDDELIAELERDYLEANGYETDLAFDGITGEQKAKTEKYDAILLDVVLPGKTGFDVCRELRKNLRLPIIMVTAKKEDIDKIRGLGLGADDYLVKPFSPAELITSEDMATNDMTPVTEWQEQKADTPVVYMTTDISSQGLMNIYQALSASPSSRIAVKLFTGEPGSNYLRTDLIGELVQSLKGTIVECNTAYFCPILKDIPWQVLEGQSKIFPLASPLRKENPISTAAEQAESGLWARGWAVHD